MVNSPQTTVKIIFIVHFLLSTWAAMFQQPFPSTAYLYMHAFVLAFAFWAIVAPQSYDAHLMFAGLNLFSIIMDIIFLSVFASYDEKNIEYNFSLAMAIINLLLKPLTSYIVLRIYQDLSGAPFSSIPGFPGTGDARTGYQSSQFDHSGNVESSTPHQSLSDQAPIIP